MSVEKVPLFKDHKNLLGKKNNIALILRLKRSIIKVSFCFDIALIFIIRRNISIFIIYDYRLQILITGQKQGFQVPVHGDSPWLPLFHFEQRQCKSKPGPRRSWGMVNCLQNKNLRKKRIKSYINFSNKINKRQRRLL